MSVFLISDTRADVGVKLHASHTTTAPDPIQLAKLVHGGDLELSALLY